MREHFVGRGTRSLLYVVDRRALERSRRLALTDMTLLEGRKLIWGRGFALTNSFRLSIATKSILAYSASLPIVMAVGTLLHVGVERPCIKERADSSGGPFFEAEREKRQQSIDSSLLN